MQPQMEPPGLLEACGLFTPSLWKPKNRNTVYLQLHCIFPLHPKITDGTPSFYWCYKGVIGPTALYGCLCFQKIAFHFSVEGKSLIHIPELLQTSLVIVCVCVQSLQLCPTLCDPMDCSTQAPLSMGILQARILKWVAMSSSRGSSWPRDWTHVSCIAGGFFIAEPPGKPVISHLENANQNHGIPLDTH